MPAPVVLFCAGATKAGTSWLYSYLQAHEDAHVGLIKELHYFDALDLGQVDRQIAEVTRARDAVLARMDEASPARMARYLAEISAYEHYLELLGKGAEDVPGYLDYLMEGREREHVVADITPAYGLLSPERLAAMGRITPNVRFLYLMRDPVARLWSHVRMIAVRRDPDRRLRRAQADNIFQRVLAGKESQISQRCNYRSAIENLRAAADPSRVMVAVAEEMWAGPARTQICAFLGIADRPPRPGPVHEGQRLQMLPAQHEAARAWLAGQYDYVEALLGGLPAAWTPDFAVAS